MSIDLPPIGYAAPTRGRCGGARSTGARCSSRRARNIRWLTGVHRLARLGRDRPGPPRAGHRRPLRRPRRRRAAAAGLDAEHRRRQHPAGAPPTTSWHGGCDGPVVAEADAPHATRRGSTSPATSTLAPDGGIDRDGCGGVKDAGELARIAARRRHRRRALADVAPMLAERPTEADVRDELEYRMRRLGADGPSYDTIVASGPHTPPARTTRPAGARSSRATRSSSTSARWSTATTPT